MSDDAGRKPPGPKLVQAPIPQPDQRTRNGSGTRFGTSQSPQVEAGQALILGRYQTTGEKIEKGKSVVCRARDIETGREVAVKEIDLGVVKDFKIFECFEREAPILKGIDHPGVVKCAHFERVEAEGSVKQFLVTEWVDGKTLARFRKDEGRLTRTQISSIMEQLAGILEYLHSLNPPVIHRDIKPENIMIQIRDGKPIVKLIDFGFALSDKSTGTTWYAINSLGFTAPEIAEGKMATRKSDIYSLGAVYLWLRTGKHAGEIKDEDDSTRYCEQLPEELSRSEKRLLRKVLHPNQKKRHKNANELHRAVKNAESRLHRRELLKANARPIWTMSPERAKQILDSEMSRFLPSKRRKRLTVQFEKPINDLENEAEAAKRNAPTVSKKILEMALNTAMYLPKAALGVALWTMGLSFFAMTILAAMWGARFVVGMVVFGEFREAFIRGALQGGLWTLLGVLGMACCTYPLSKIGDFLFRPKTFKFKSNDHVMKKILETVSVKALVLLKTKGNEVSEKARQRLMDLLTPEDRSSYEAWLKPPEQVRVALDAIEEQPRLRVDTAEQEAEPEEAEPDSQESDERFRRKA